jgi:lipopolysaccharide assembly outer membrane protein LptD (OstA)
MMPSPKTMIALTLVAFGALAFAVPTPTERAVAASVPGPLPDASNAQITPPDSAPASDKSKPRVVRVIHADLALLHGKIRTLEGHVHITEGDTDFYADRILYDEEKKTGEASQDPTMQGGSVGPPMAKDDLNTLTADQMTLDFSSKDPAKKVVSATGHVQFVAKPRPKDDKKGATAASVPDSGKEDAAPTKPASTGDSASKGEDDSARKARMEKKIKEETTLVCDHVDYFYRIKRAEAWGGLKVVQGKRWLTGDKATYYERYDTVLVNGHVKGQDEKGRTFEADNLKVDMSGEDDVMEANQFHGVFELDEEEDESKNSTDSAPPALPGAPAAKPNAAP